MPTAFQENTSPLVAADFPPRKHWTRAEVELLETSGAFDGQHYELVEGDLISKMGKKRPHYSGVASSTRRLAKAFPEELVFPETPIDVRPQDNPTSHPEPDVVVLSRPLKEIVGEYPQPGDVALVLEVADSTLKYDLTVRAALYARAGIVEYWVLDVFGRRLIVHREAQAGVYSSITAYAATESVTPLFAPGQSILVSDLLG